MKEIITGKKAEFTVRLVSRKTKDPFDFTLCTAITTCFENDDGSQLSLSLGAGITQLGSPLIGKLKIGLTAAQTRLLRPVTSGTIELAITLSSDSGNPIPAVIDRAYSVIDSQC